MVFLAIWFFFGGGGFLLVADQSMGSGVRAWSARVLSPAGAAGAHRPEGLLAGVES